jgi:hypothetical protein
MLSSGRLAIGFSRREPFLFLEKNMTDAQLAANRANAQLSTGPSSPDGKTKVSLNAVKTALTGQTVMLPTDDAAAYERHLRGYQKMLHPLGEPECDLVQSIADTAWRLRRIPALEMTIISHGHVEFANCFDEFDGSLRPSLIDRHTFLTYEKQLRNLQLQEARLQRRRDKEMAELRKLQQERDQREKIELETAAKLYLAARHDRKPFHPADRGFEFSIQDIEAYLEGVRAANIAHATLNKDRNLTLEALKARAKAA